MNTVLSVLIICGFLYLSFVTWMFRRKSLCLHQIS